MSGWVPTGAQPEAGWRRDPSGRFDERLWNGRRWTPRVRVGRSEAIERGAPPSADADAEWRPDPTGRFELRLWRAGGWTRWIRVGDAPAVDVLSVPVTSAPSRAERQADASGPGWRPDPDDPSLERFWDGRELTVKTRAAGRRPDRARLRWWAHPAVLLAGVLVLLVVALALAVWALVA